MVEPGSFLGEVSIMRDMPRLATVRATKPTTLLAIDRDTFRGLVAQSLGTTEDFDRVIQERLERLS
jgi:CRP-like cAMP-binding protein